MKKLTTGVLAASMATLLTAGAALAAIPTVTITSPQNGSTVSRSTNPTLALAGGVAFDTPMPSERKIYLRNTSTGSTGCFADTHLSEQDGADPGSGCSQTLNSASLVPGFEETFIETYNSRETGIPFPITVDGTRSITGSIAISSVTPNAAVMQVRIGFDGTVVGTATIDTGLYTNSWLIQSPSPSYPFTIPIPPSFDKKDIQSVGVELIWKRNVNVGGSTWTELDDPASFVTVPSYTASFDRKVQVAVDSGTFSSTGITVAPGLSSWSGSIATPSAGFAHSIKARAIQGGVASATAEITVTVTP